jgi:hypothetical protein
VVLGTAEPGGAGFRDRFIWEGFFMSLREPSEVFSPSQSPDNSACKRPASERRIQANRRNALRSTGPKTARGKGTVARNAIKHGLLAREVVITAGDGKESLEEFDALVERLWEFYEPVGVVEELLVEKIATCWWRKARAIRAENGEIRKRLDTIALNRALQNSDKGNLAVMLAELELDYRLGNPADANLSIRDLTAARQDLQRTLRGHQSGLAFLRSLLEKAKSEIASDGCISERLREDIFMAFCCWDYSFAIACLCDGPTKVGVEERPSEKVVPKRTDEERATFIAFIDDELEKLSVFKEYALIREEQERDAEARSFSLPPTDATDKILRYETQIDRQLYRAMDELERLQRRRRGENVPPPLNVNLGRRS